MLRLELLSLLLLLHLAGVSAQAAASTPDNERELLLTFKAGITNWDEVQAAWGLDGWQSCSTGPKECLSACTWGGVECNPYHRHQGNHVTALYLECLNCTVPLRGQLKPGLNRLQHLEYLHIHGNQLSGPLPVEWGEPDSFPELLELNLNDNLFTGNMPPEWSIGPAFPMVLDLQLAGNRLSGPFPQEFAVTNTSFWSVMSVNFANNDMTGALPDYINGMITMDVVRLENNMFTGTLPPDWGTQGYLFNSTLNNTQALETLALHGNQLTGTLPDAWADPGSFTVLKQLTLSGNPGLFGTLPAAWGANIESLPALQHLNVSLTNLSGPLPPWGPYPQNLKTLTIYGNSFSGSIPPSWAQLGKLEQVTLQPGNADVCAALPEDANFQLCISGDLLCWTPCNQVQACAQPHLPAAAAASRPPPWQSPWWW